MSNTKDFNIFLYRNFYNGGGVSVGDLNNDGLPEVFFTSNMGENKLYLNKGGFKFEDITISAGIKNSGKWGTGVSFVDINGDGWLDIYVCFAGFQKGKDQKNELYINNRDLTFREQAASFNLDENGYTTQTAFFDFDKDGDLDAYVLNNSFMPVNTLNYNNKRDLPAQDWPVKDFLKGGGDRLLKNENGKFKDVTKECGIYSSLIGFGLGISIADFNEDGWEDIYISNDFFERDYLYINNQKGHFTEEVRERLSHMSSFSMGADAADIDNDGHIDLFTTDMLPSDRTRLVTTSTFEDYNTFKLKLSRDFYYQYMQNCLQMNRGDGTFRDIAYYAGVAASDWSWGVLLFDINNDGYRDIYVTNGIYHDVTNQDFIDFFANETITKMALSGTKMDIDKIINKMPSVPIKNKIFISNGNHTFSDFSDNDSNSGTFSNGVAYGDLDSDGDLDVVVNNVNQEALVLKNNAIEHGKNHYIKVNLVGDQKNLFSIGAKVKVYASKKQWLVQQMPFRGFQSSVDYVLSFGLGDVKRIDSILVDWTDGEFTVVRDLPVDTIVQISKQEKTKPLKYNAVNQHVFFKELKSPFLSLKEDDFVDFYTERLQIKMLSREGPKATAGDVDGNGFVDVFIGGPTGSSSSLYLQNEKGFVLSKKSGLEKELYFEDTACEFFDADRDGDLDLFVGSGGNNNYSGSSSMQDRVYINNGMGNFKLDPTALSNNGMNTSAVLVFDLDSDGDNDLLVGSRSVPLNYGMTPQHFVYENNGSGKFKNVQEAIIPELKSAGMITDISSADLDGDGKHEIVIVGEWMAPLILKQVKGKYVSMKSGLLNKSGWWNSICTDDIDRDGDIDLILGNRGENFYFSADSLNPAKLWVNDFDNNGKHEAIITTSKNGKDWPVPMKRDLMQQITSLKKQNLKFSDYALKSIDLLFDPDLLDKSLVWQAMYFKSGIAINDGSGRFTLSPLPAEVQFSSVNAILSVDVNGDQFNDLVMGGNETNFLPQFSKLDGSFGNVLLNDGKGGFKLTSNSQSGLLLKGDLKQLMMLKLNERDVILGLINEKQPKLLELIRKN